MALIHNTNSIVTSGLVLALDAANIKSYSGSGATTWSDLSGNGNTGTLVNSPTYSSLYGGSLVFNGVDGKVSTNYKPSGVRSYFIWVKFSSLTSASGYQVSGTQESNAYTYIGIQNGGDIYYYAGASTGGNIGNPVTVNTWVSLGFVLNADGSRIVYKNGVNIHSNSGGLGGTATLEFSVGCINNAYHINGNIAQVSIYNRALSAAEVSQNYNALKSRYLIQYIDPYYPYVSLLLRNSFTDESPSPKTITQSGSANISSTIFKYGTGALSFNGTGGVSAEYNSDLDLAGNDFTIEAWVRLNSYLAGGTGATIVDRYTSTSRSYYFNIYYSSYQGSYYLFFGWTTNNSTVLQAYAAIPTPNLSIFSHYSVVRSGSQILFFVDGVNCPLSGQSALGTFYNQPTPLNIGSANTVSGFNALNGYIDDLRITKGVARYTANFTPPTTESSTGYYKI